MCRANIAFARPSDRVNAAAIMAQVVTRGQAIVYAENALLQKGASLSNLLPSTIHGQPVFFSQCGALDRIRPTRSRHAGVVQLAAV